MRKRAGLSPWAWAAAAAGLLAVALRLLWLGHGLPQAYNPDEAQMIGAAVTVGGGSLRQQSFQYPALWPTLLAGLYGMWFSLWSVFGLRKSPLDFAALYGFAPTGFFLIARLVAAGASLGTLAVVVRAERREDGARWPFGALVLAFAPAVVELSRLGRPDALACLGAAGAWACALRFQAGGARGWLYAAAVLAGAACSTHYAAVLAALAVPLAWLLRDEGPAPWTWLAQALGVGAAAFFVGSPFVAIDFRRFLADWTDYADLVRLRGYDAGAATKDAAYALWTFGGDGSPAGAAAALGIAALLWRRARRALLLAIPVLLCAVASCVAPVENPGVLLVGLFPALALLSGEGLSFLGGSSPLRRGLVAVLALSPGLIVSWNNVADLCRPDTRAQASAWMASHIPEGETVLLDLPHVSPRALPSQQQCRDLAARAGSPRARLWQAMADRHPGGGWRVYRIQRFTPKRSMATEGVFLDVRPGLDPVRAVRAHWVVTSSLGADPRRARELATFFSELASGADLVQEFPYEFGKTTGPWLRVWRLRR